MYQDLGSKPSEVKSAGPETIGSKKVYFPNLYLTLDSVPDLKLGEDFEAKVKLCVSGIRKNSDGKMSIDFEVKAIDLGGSEKKTKSKGQELEELVSEDMKEMDRD